MWRQQTRSFRLWNSEEQTAMILKLDAVHAVIEENDVKYGFEKTLRCEPRIVPGNEVFRPQGLALNAMGGELPGRQYYRCVFHLREFKEIALDVTKMRVLIIRGEQRQPCGCAW